MHRAVLLLVPLLTACASPGAAAPAPCAPCASSGRAASPDEAPARAPRSAKLDELAERRVALAHEHVRVVELAFQQGLTKTTEILLAYREAAVAARDSGLTGEKLRKELTAYRDAMVQLQQVTDSRHSMGATGPSDEVAARQALAEAEYWLEEANERGP